MKLTEVFSELGRSVAYYPELARMLGSVNEAIFLSQFLYWTDRTETGWVYKTRQQIAEETGLSLGEQRAARACLKKAGFIQDKYLRSQHLLYFKVDITALNAAWDAHIKKKGACVKITNGRNDTCHVLKRHVPCVKLTNRLYTESTNRVLIGADAPYCGGDASLAPDGAPSSANADSAEDAKFQKFYRDMLLYWNTTFHRLSGGKYKPKKQDSPSIRAFFQTWGHDYEGLEVAYVLVKAWLKSKDRPPKPGQFDILWKSRRALHSLAKFLDTFPEIKTEIMWNDPSDEEMMKYLGKTVKMVFKE